MMRKSYFKILAAACFAAYPAATCLASLPEMVMPTREEKAAMLSEADDFIDDMPEGLQDRQCDAVLHALKGVGMELTEVRNSRNATQEYSAGVKVEDINPSEGEARGLKMRLYRPEAPSEGKLPLLVYFHGGGWTIGSLNSCARFCDALAATGKVMVLAADYSLAPENPFPEGLGDCLAAASYAFGMVEKWGGDSSKVSLGGDSSGGNLALAAAMCMAAEEGNPSLRSLLLIYPVVDASRDGTDSWREYSRGYGLDGRLMEAFNAAYRGGRKEMEGEVRGLPSEWLVSPSGASDAVLKKLPPMLMISAQRDILVEQGERFSTRLKGLGNDVERVEFPGAVHLFITVPGQPTSFRKAVDLSSVFLAE